MTTPGLKPHPSTDSLDAMSTRAIVTRTAPRRLKNRKGLPTSPAERAGRIIQQIVLGLAMVIVLYPVVWMIMSSFKPSNQILGDVSPWPSTFTLDNFVTALAGIGGIGFWQFAGNSTILAVGSVIGIVVSSSLTAYAFTRINFRGRKISFAFMIATLLLPMHVIIIPQYIVFQKLGLVDTFVPLLLPKFLATEAFFIFLMVQFLRGLPRELDEAARIDGAGHPRIFWSIILPLLRPAVVTSSIFAFIWSWNDFFGPLIYLNSPSNYPLPIALRLFVDQTSTSDYGAQMAMAVLALLPVLLFFLFFQRFLISGVATQGMKG